MDGSTRGDLEFESFSADAMTLTFVGFNTHPGYAKDRLVNAIKVAAAFICRLPRDMAPETTDGYDGFVHPYVVQASVDKTSVRLLIRDFVTARLQETDDKYAKARGTFEPAGTRVLIGDDDVAIAGDAGGTKTNMALFRADENGVTQLREARYVSHEYSSLTDIIIQFAASEWPDRICVAVAGPVLNGKVKLTNLNWQLDSDAMSAALKLPVVFLNDLEATAYGLAGIQSNELVALHSDGTSAEGNIALISPGTGLGEAGLYWDGSAYHPFAAEGGHSDFAVRTEQDIELYRFLQQQFGHVSWERVVSGPGIHAIFNFLTTVQRKIVPPWLTEEMKEDDPSAVISNAALHQNEAVCMEALQLFSRYLATEAASLVLKLKATGGCYIGGGIPPKILPVFQTGEWLKNFTAAGRMKPLLQQVPVYLILNQKLPLLGAAYYAAFSIRHAPEFLK
jgi:glucokinase